MIGKHVDPLLGHLRLTAVTPQLLDLFYAELLRCRGHCRHPNQAHICHPLYPATVRKIHYVISGAFRRAVRWGWIDDSPTRDAQPPPKPHPEPQPPTPAEAAHILDAAWADPDLGPLVWLAMVTGARRGELCALRWRHLALDATTAQTSPTTTTPASAARQRWASP
jgi:integrase